MNYKEKRLAEFDVVSVYWFSNEDQYNINKEECRDFLAESITQAIAEERERLLGEIEKVKFTIYDGDIKREVVGLEDLTSPLTSSQNKPYKK